MEVATFPVLVTVSVCAPLAVPENQLPKANGVGETFKVRTAATAVPVNATGDPFTATLAVRVAVPLLVPGAAGAVNTILMLQFVPAARVAPHVPGPPCAAVARENGAVTLAAIALRPLAVLL